MQQSEIVIIENVDYVVLGGSRKAIQQAIDKTRQGSVLMIVGGTHLAEDICDTNRYGISDGELLFQKQNSEIKISPNEYQNRMEDVCKTAGIKVLYFIRLVDVRVFQNDKIVRVAGKGGLFGIRCRCVIDCGEISQNENYIAIVTEENKADYGLLEVKLEKSGNRMDASEQLFFLRKALIEKFIEQRKTNETLRLGRFAVRGYGEPLFFASSQKEGRKENYYVTGQNRFHRFKNCRLPKKEATVTAKEECWDLVVVGGGTAGAMAAIHGSRNGLRTVLIEPNYDLGGTQTVGGVSTYWFGHRYSDVKEIDSEIDRISRACGIIREQGIWAENDDYHAGIRGYVYLKKCLEAGVKVVFGQIAYGTVFEKKDDKKYVTGVITAGDYGNCVFYGKAIIDSTGDGDIAVAAGASSCYGSERDLITYWGSLAQYTSAQKYKNNFSSTLFSEDPVDYTRFIEIGRKRGGKIFDHGSYVSMRESRHIKGKYTVTLQDLITYKTYRDGLYTCYSNYDPKGKLDADIVYFGVLPPQTSIQIPLSALIPVDENGNQIHNLYVAGKAISATHNVFPSIRMQSDLMHQGAVLGAVLAKSLPNGIMPEEMDEDQRRNFLLQYTDDPLDLPTIQINASMSVNRLFGNERLNWVDADLRYEEIGASNILQILASVNKEDRRNVQAEIERRLFQEKDWKTRQNLIMCALWYDMNGPWVKELQREIDQELLSGKLPERIGSVMCAQMLPDHGVMPELVYKLNQLGTVQDPSILSSYQKVLEILEHTDRDYYDIRKGIYHYIEAFAYAAVHSHQKGFIPALKRLKQFPELRTCVQEKEPVDLLTERLQILVFILNRALAELEDIAGYGGLIEMLSVDNMIIRGSAALTLQKLTGKKYGVCAEAWRKEAEHGNPFRYKLYYGEKIW